MRCMNGALAIRTNTTLRAEWSTAGLFAGQAGMMVSIFADSGFVERLPGLVARSEA